MKPKKLPRLWCALHGLLPLDACLAAQRGELAWPAEPAPGEPAAIVNGKGVAPAAGAQNVQRDGPVPNQSRDPRRQHQRD